MLHNDELMRAMRVDAQNFIGQHFRGATQGWDEPLAKLLAEKFASLYVKGGVAALGEHLQEVKDARAIATAGS